jgi:hypothetical protein
MDIQEPVNQTNFRLFNSNVKSELHVLYGAETWRTTVNTTKKIQTFITNCLRRILQIRWPDNISNEELWQRTNQKSVDLEIRQCLEKDRPYVYQPPTLQDKPSDGTCRKRQRGTGHKTPAVETSRKMQRQTTHRRSWRDSHKTEKAGEN